MRILLALFSTIYLNVISGQSFEMGIQYYENNDFKSAAKTWQVLIDQGQRTTSNYYNLGNAYYQLNNYPEAIYNYSKALILNPQWKDAKINLKMTQKIAGVEEIELPGWNLKNQILKISNALSALNFIILYGLLFVIAIIALNYLKQKFTPLLAKALFFAASMCLIFSIVQLYHKLSNNEAILMIESPIFLSPDEISEKKLELKAGEKLVILDQIKEWSKIQTSNYEIGWIEDKKYRKLN